MHLDGKPRQHLGKPFSPSRDIHITFSNISLRIWNFLTTNDDKSRFFSDVFKYVKKWWLVWCESFTHEIRLGGYNNVVPANCIAITNRGNVFVSLTTDRQENDLSFSYSLDGGNVGNYAIYRATYFLQLDIPHFQADCMIPLFIQPLVRTIRKSFTHLSTSVSYGTGGGRVFYVYKIPLSGYLEYLIYQMKHSFFVDQGAPVLQKKIDILQKRVKTLQQEKRTYKQKLQELEQQIMKL